MPPFSRRDFLQRSGGGLGAIALAAMLGENTAAGIIAPAHVAPRAKRVVQFFMAGAASHLDTFDFKPALIEHHGEKSDFGEHVEAFQNGLGPWMKSPWKFSRHGGCGKQLSEVVAPLGSVVDDIAFIHNLVGKTGVHSQATYLQATGFQRPGFPGMGNWISYALGSMNDRTGPPLSCPRATAAPSSFPAGRIRSPTSRHVPTTSTPLASPRASRYCNG